MKRSLKVYFNFEVHKVYFVLSIVFRDYSLAEIDVNFLLLKENTAKTPLIRPGHIYRYRQKANLMGLSVPHPKLFWPYQYMYWRRDFKKSIGEHTIRQTDWQKFWLYLAAFRCQTTKQSYKIIRYKKNGLLLNWLNLKKIGEVFKNFGLFFGRPYWFNSMKIRLYLGMAPAIFEGT